MLVMKKNDYTFGDYIDFADLFELRTYSSEPINEATLLPGIDIRQPQ
jgi:hypothetical protein